MKLCILLLAATVIALTDGKTVDPLQIHLCLVLMERHFTSSNDCPVFVLFLPCSLTCFALGSENRLLCCCCRMKKDDGRARRIVLHNSVIKEDEQSPGLFWLNLVQFSLLTWPQVCRRSTGTTTHAATACKWSPGLYLQRACGASSSFLKGLTVQRRKLCELSNVQWRNGVGFHVTIYCNTNSADS